MPRQRTVDAVPVFRGAIAQAAARAIYRIDRHRKAEGISNRALADALGVSHPTIAGYFKYPHRVSLTTFITLCYACGVDPDAVLSVRW